MVQFNPIDLIDSDNNLRNIKLRVNANKRWNGCAEREINIL